MKTILRAIGLLFLVSSFNSVIFAQDIDPETIIQTIEDEVEAELLQSFESPFGNLRAEVHVYPCTENEGDTLSYSYERLDIIAIESAESTLLAEQLINCGGLGAFGLWVTDWTDDYIYYTDSREGSPDGFAGFWNRTIWRADLETLTVDNLGGAVFSPDRQWLLSSPGGSLRLIPANGEDIIEFALIPDGLQLTQLIWLPDQGNRIKIGKEA